MAYTKDDVTETAEALDMAANQLERAAREVRQFAKSMRTKSDLTYAGEAAHVIAQVVGQCRLDLFVIRLLRARGR